MGERVVLRFRGLMVEKFLGRALNSGVTFEAVEPVGAREARLVTSAQGAATLMKLAERFALDVTEVERTGLRTLGRRIMRRATLPLSLLLGAALTMAFLGRLWVIDVVLLDGSADAAPICEALEARGVRPGVRADSIDPKQLSLALEDEAGEFSYIGVRRQGVRLLVEATRALPAPELYDHTAARDLVASRDALLVSLDVMAGTARAQVGHVVKKGDLLIGGEERDGRETTRGVCARGAAVGKVWLTGEAEAATGQLVAVPTGATEQSSELTLVNRSITLTSARGFADQRITVERLPIGGLIVPLHIVRTTYEQQQMVDVPRDIEALKEEIAQKALEMAEAQLPQGIVPIDKWTEFRMIEGGRLRARVTLEIEMNVAVAREAMM